ncbi:MAG: hypothetical protein ACI9S6_000612, partial [Reinekea sp.]
MRIRSRYFTYSIVLMVTPAYSLKRGTNLSPSNFAGV